MDLTSINKTARYVFNEALTSIMMLVSEVMQRNNTMPTTPDNQIFAKVSVLNGAGAVMFHSLHNGRVAWVTPYLEWDGASKGNWLIWFGTNSLEHMVEVDEGNLVPDRRTCESARLVTFGIVLSVVEEYIVRDIKPHNTMPGGHLKTLNG